MLGISGSPHLPQLPPIWREGRSALELAALVRDPVFRDVDEDAGGGMPVLLVPGLLAGDGSLGLMTGWLRRQGYRTRRAGMRFNVACSATAVTALAQRAEELASLYGEPVTVIGQSRGGTLARALADRRPELVRGIVTLGSPHLDPLAVHPLVLAQVGLVGILGTLGVPGLFSDECLDGDCCADFRRSFKRPFPDGVGYVSIYSRSDGIVDWRACLDPAATPVEVAASHIGMAVHAGTYRAIATALRSFAAAPARRAAIAA